LRKKYPEAKSLLKESYAGIASAQGRDSPLTREASLRLATLYHSWNKPEEAGKFQLSDGLKFSGNN